jgi:hypothetical protein
MIRHFIVTWNAAPREWDPANPDPSLPKDCIYLGKALAEMERHLGDEDLVCYLTWEPDRLPEYGPHVIAVLVGEEWGMMPRYARHVRLTGRVLGRYPFLGIRNWWPLNWLKILLTVKYLRNWMRHLRSVIRMNFPPKNWPAPVHKEPRIVHLPWGSAGLVERPLKLINERPQNYFFSGGISTGADSGLRKRLGTPKVIVRLQLVEALKRLEEKYPNLSTNTTVAIHASPYDLKDDEAYAQRLMDAKVCLAPRGTTADTWRLFEGLKSGSIVITNPLPDEWYYRDAPVIQVDDWSELEGVMLPLLADETRMQQLQDRALDYWKNVCGDQALGRYLAAAVKESVV